MRGRWGRSIGLIGGVSEVGRMMTYDFEMIREENKEIRCKFEEQAVRGMRIIRCRK